MWNLITPPQVVTADWIIDNDPLLDMLIRAADISKAQASGWLHSRWITVYNNQAAAQLLMHEIYGRFIECFLSWFAIDWSKIRAALNLAEQSPFPCEGSAIVTMWDDRFPVSPSGQPTHTWSCFVSNGAVYGSPFGVISVSDFLKRIDSAENKFCVLNVSFKPEERLLT